MNIDEFIGAGAVILFSWTTVLLWATWRLRGLAKDLDTERQAMRRWKRLERLAKGQNSRWQ